MSAPATDADSFSIIGSMPPGLSYDPLTGTIRGTPTTAGTYGNIVIIATNASGSVSLPAFSITVIKPPPTIAGTPFNTITVGTVYNFTPTSTDADSFSIIGSMPPGLSFDPLTGTISGTSTTTGTYSNIVIIATNASGSVSRPDQLALFASGEITLDHLTKAYIHKRLEYQFAFVHSSAEAYELERQCRNGSVFGSKPLLNPL